MRIISIISKELKCVREDISFNLATLISPLLFLIAFSLMLSGGILLPVQTYPYTQSSAFLDSMENYKAPDGTAYFELHPAKQKVPPTNAESDLIVVEQEPSIKDNIITGKITHYLNDVNENTTKNFRNRLDGALVNYIDTFRSGGNVFVNETTMYEQDIPWDTGFGASVLVFGLILSGLIFGMLSITSEWGNHTTMLLKLSPCSPGITITGKILANSIKCFVSGIIYLFVFFLISKVLPAHMLTFIVSILLVYGIFICFGMCLGIFIKSSLTAFLISLVSALVLWVGGGGFGPLSYYGSVANVLGKINPATYAIEIIRWCYFNGNTHLTTGFIVLVSSMVLAFSLIAVIYTRWTHREEVKS
ncbi:TPA: ABC transporter permease [Clostridioides difficile]|nr:ABC transporter permease [Clostridioides difficile]